MYTVAQILNAMSVLRSQISDKDMLISSLAYDTRKLNNSSGSLFFAIKQHRDGHAFIKEAYQQGVRNFVISDINFQINKYQDANFIWVADTLAAMQELATFHRSQFSYPIIGITGSNGKTIVKEWLKELLNPEINCYQSPKSYNSQLGVALSVWNLGKDLDLALIEAGISLPDEMNHLEKMIRPTWGVFTNLGSAHDEGFSSIEEKLEEKWKLFEKVEKIVSPSSFLPEAYKTDTRLVTWGSQQTDALHVLGITKDNISSTLDLSYGEEKTSMRVPFVDKASIDNILTCVLTMLEMNFSFADITIRINQLKPLEMRLQLKRGRFNSSIIDDTYSNDIASLQIALDFLRQQNQHDRKILILSDFEGEQYTDDFKAKVESLLAVQSLDEIILVGNRLGFLVNTLSTKIEQFSDAEDFLNHISDFAIRDASILIKGARRFHLETISEALVEKSHDTVFEINLKALEHNLHQYRAQLQPGVKMMAMVKAFSYGSGSFEVANVLQFNKVDYLTVAFVDEGAELRRAGVELPIMVLSPHEGTFEDLLNYNLEPEIYSFRILKSFHSFLERKGVLDYPIHIKLDTGMHRLGFMQEEVSEMLDFITETKVLKVVSTFSHLVGAGSDDLKDFTNYQIQIFKDTAAQLEQSLGYPIIKHICNTTGITHHPEAHFDMVRLGIGLYGYDMAQKHVRLQDVGVLKTTITQIKKLSKTETVGYDRKGKLTRDSVIATVKIGYADGYNRKLGNGIGKMYVNGYLVPTVGNICMDMCMLDITDVLANEGDEVLVFPDVALSAKEIGTIPYELLTGISSRVKRVYFYE